MKLFIYLNDTVFNIYLFIKNKNRFKYLKPKLISYFGDGDWGLGIGDWGLGPIPNSKFQIAHPQSPPHNHP